MDLFLTAKFSVYALATVAGELISAGANASQDSNHYLGFQNPNLSDAHYYAYVINVLQDMVLGKFDKLYINFRSCVWSSYEMGTENNQNNQDDGGPTVKVATVATNIGTWDKRVFLCQCCI